MTISCIVINLDRDVDRLAHMQHELDSASLRMQRFPAVRGDAVPEEIALLFDPKVTKLLSPGEIGCYASHLSVLSRIASGEIPSPALILEDDVRLAPDFAAILTQTLAVLPPNWDLVRLSNNPKHAYLNHTQLGGNRTLVRYSNVPGSSGAILWSQCGAKKFLTPPQRQFPIDQDLRRVWIWNLNTFGVYPPPVERDIFEVSSIDSYATPGWRRNKARVKLVRRQRALEMFQRHLYVARQLGWARFLRAEYANFQAAFVPKDARSKFLRQKSAQC